MRNKLFRFHEFVRDAEEQYIGRGFISGSLVLLSADGTYVSVYDPSAPADKDVGNIIGILNFSYGIMQMLRQEIEDPDKREDRKNIIRKLYNFIEMYI